MTYSAPTEAPVRLSYSSKPFYQRPAFVPAAMTVVGLTAVTYLLVVSALKHISHYGMVAGLVAISAGLIAVYLGIFVRRWLLDLFRRYQIDFCDESVSFAMFDRLQRRRTSVRIPYSQIDYVEDFSPRDYAYLIFHLNNNDNRVVTVPIWSMTTEPGPILAFLLEKRVRIVHV